MHQWLRRIAHDRPILLDLVVMATGLVAAWASLYLVAGQVGWATALVLGIIPALALIRVRRTPLVPFGLSLAAALGTWVLAVPVNGAQISLAISLYAVARFESVRAGRIAFGLCLALVVIASARQPYQGLANSMMQVLFLAAVWVLGTNIALRQNYLRALEERAARLERERDAAVHTAALTERTRIAREMHDVVAHHVSVMVVQAEGASWAIDSAPDDARSAVTTIAETGRSTLTELRRLLGVLRDGEAESVYPQPELTDIQALADEFRRSGLEVRFGGVPEVAGVPESVQLAVYRVIQEGLTNVLKHVGVGARVSVEVVVEVGEMRVEVADEGRPGSPTAVGGAVVEAVASKNSAVGHKERNERGQEHGQGNGREHGNRPGPGHGLIGIRERAALFGGTTQIGPRPGGGFAVRATFPVAAP